MISTADKKLLRKLQRKKYRWQERLFTAEGPKVVSDLLDSGLKPFRLWAIHPESWPAARACTVDDLQSVSQLSTAHEVIAVFPFPERVPDYKSSCLILDGISDPGNLGTLLRTAHWFGFRQIFATHGTADVYNWKTVQSTMGSLGKVNVHYCDTEELINKLMATHQWLVADMEGEAPETIRSNGEALALVLGSESHGPAEEWQKLGHGVSISARDPLPPDSLNVAAAGAILMHHFAGWQLGGAGAL